MSTPPTEFLIPPHERARNEADRLLAQSTAGRGTAFPETKLPPNQNPVENRKARQAERQRAAVGGLVTGEVFRRKLGLSHGSFRGAVRDGLVPPPLCERHGTAFWLREVADEAARRLGR